MDYCPDSVSMILTDRPLKKHGLSFPFKRILEVVTYYETPKVVRFESKCIASLSLFVKLSLAIGCMYLMCQRSSYQLFDRSPISAVIIKVKSSNCSNGSSIMPHFLNYNCTQSSYDVNDFILPAIENSAISITTRIMEVEHILKICDNTTIKNKLNEYSPLYKTPMHKCYDRTRCILPPYYRYEYENETIIEKTKLCWFKSPLRNATRNYQALDYVLFIRHFVEFTQLGLVRNNLAVDIMPESYFNTCEYDPTHHPLCPRFRILKILQMVEKKPNEYESMFDNGSIIEIKISWQCNLDKNLSYCVPNYKFKHLDFEPHRENPYYTGSTFLTARHFFEPVSRELYRTHTKIYNLHIIVSVTGEVGKFDLFQTTTSIGSFLGIFSTGTIVCDLIAAFFTNFKSVKYDG